jgi:LacI family transcriptional regulator
MHRYPGTDTDMVGVDNQGGIFLLVEHLRELGHEKIGFLGRCGEIYWATARFGSYVSALNASGLEYDPAWVVDADAASLTDQRLGWESYLEKVESLIQQGVRAWICAAEPVGARLHDWLVARGYSIPRDVSITGFHRPDKVSPGHPPLTSVVASYEAIGAAALKRLLYRIQNPSESTRTILFPCDIFPGATATIPPR